MHSTILRGLPAGIALVALLAASGSAADPAPAAAEQASRESGHHAHIGAAGVSEDPAEFKTDLAVYTFLVFLGLLGLLYKFAWGPITDGLERRERSVIENITNAEAARVKAEKMLADHAAKLDKVQDEVRGILAEARRDAEHTKSEIVAAAQREAEASRQRAVQDIERARDQALDDLFAHMGRCVKEATEQVVGRSLTEADHERLIEEALTSVTGK